MVAVARNDAADLARMPDKVKQDVYAWMEIVEAIERAPKRETDRVVGMAAVRMRVSKRTVWRKLGEWRETGDWRVFVPAWVCGSAGGLPAKFVEWFKGQAEGNQRKSKPAYRELVRMWRRGEAITGYDKRPEAERGKDLPKGWSYANLMKAARASTSNRDFELMAMRAGLGKAILAHGPQVLTTRVGLWVGSHYLIDDLLRDMKLMLLGKGGQIVRPQELGVLDLFSGDRFAVHRRPVFTRRDGTQDRLKESETRFMAASVLRNYGYSPRGTEWVSELGTAALRQKLQTWMHQHSGGKISVREPGTLGKIQAIAGWEGRGGGNPRHKSRLESHHALDHNESGFMLAATGHDRCEPEWLHGVERDAENVLKLLRTLPPQRAAQLAVGMVEFWQGLDLLSQIDEEIAWRTDHELEGWEACNHVIVEYRRDAASQEWLTPEQLLEMKNGEALAIVQAAHADEACRRPRKLSPREVFARGLGDLVKMPDYVIALLFADRELGDDLRFPKTLTADGDFEIQDRTVEPEEMHFLGTVETPEGGRLLLEAKKEYQVVLNPFDREGLWVFRGDGGFVGTAPRLRRAGMLDQGAIERQLGYRAKTLAAMTAPLGQRHAGMAQRIEEMQRENQAIAAGVDPVRAKQEDKVDRKRAVGAEAFTEEQLSSGYAQATPGQDSSKEETTAAGPEAFL